MKKIAKQKGFTLVEVMVVIFISAMIVYAIFTAMRAGDAQAQMTQLRMLIQDSAREGLYKMVQEIRMSAPDQITFLNGNTMIQFLVPSADVNPANSLNGDYTVNWNVPPAQMIQYARVVQMVNGMQLQQIVRTNLTAGTPPTIIANDVTGLTFAGNALQPTVVTVTMQVQRQMMNGRLVPAQPLQMTAQAEIRNR